MKTEFLKGKNIFLRAPEPGDIETLYKWENDTSLWIVSNTQTPFSRFVLEEYIANAHADIYTAKQLRLMICLNNKENKAIGCVDLFDFDPANLRAGIGILIGEKNERGKGYAAETLKIMIDYSFRLLHLHQLYCNITAENESSIKLFQKYKFKITGLKKDWIRETEKWTDEYTLQLINKDS